VQDEIDFLLLEALSTESIVMTESARIFYSGLRYNGAALISQFSLVCTLLRLDYPLDGTIKALYSNWHL
jgi:hypothetical protein